MTTALITGASAGLGAEFATQLAASGHDLVLVSRTRSDLEAVAERLRAAYGIRTEVLPADLSNRDDLERVAQRVATAGELGPIDLLVNNAGYGLRTSFLRGDIAAEETMLDVLCRATLVLSHAAGRAMRERGRGTIVNVASVAAFIPGGTYAAAKAWVTTFTESLALELAGTGVTATAVCPGFTHTQFHQRAEMNMSSLPALAWLDAPEVVRQGLADARRGRVISVPSKRYAALSTAIDVLPRSVVRAVIGRGSHPARRRNIRKGGSA
ncbi:MAG: SDR family oxidoreductase [Dermatophilus congolensis]|nr:SDR family oxidoreductase [Dermatophilus congolensis]